MKRCKICFITARRFPVYYIGLDVHQHYITVCILNSNGLLHHRCRLSSIYKVVELIGKLDGPCEVCYEASTGYGFIFEALLPVTRRTVVAHPGLLRLIYRSKKKNDRADAEKLAKLLYIGEVPVVYVPSSNVRAWRELITFRRRTVEKRTRAKNGIRGLLRSLGIKQPEHIKLLWTIKGRKWLSELELDNTMHSLKRAVLVAEIEMLDNQIKAVEKELAAYAEKSPAVAQLRTIPGVGIRTAEAVAAFIDNPHRFANSKQIGAYFGLVPMQDQSGNKNHLGHITKQGSSTVRHLLTEAVWQATRRSPTVRAYRDRIAREDPQRRKIAIVATAHYLIRVMWSMLRNNTTWQEQSLAA